MRTYGLYDATRGLTTSLAAGVAGLLLWLATQVGQTGAARFWESMGIVAAAGLVMALSQVLGGWTKGLTLRLSPGTFLLGFVPVLVVVGWILMATQPGNGWHEGTVVSWSHDIGLMGVIHALGLWHGVLAFGFGLVLGMSFDSVPAPAAAPAPVAETAPQVAEAAPVERRRRTWRRRPAMDKAAADEPLAAEQREAAHNAEPRTVTVGPRSQRERVPETMD